MNPSLGLEPDEFKIIERRHGGEYGPYEHHQHTRGSHRGGDRGGNRGGRGRGQGHQTNYVEGRGAFRGGRGGRPTPKPAFTHYSDLTVSSDKAAESVGQPSDVIPFNIASPDILRVKANRQHTEGTEDIKNTNSTTAFSGATPSSQVDAAGKIPY